MQEGWWTLCYTAVDMAIYPVLFVNYLAFFIPALALGEDGTVSWSIMAIHWAIAANLIGLALALTRGRAHLVGSNAKWNLVLVLAPFALLVTIGFWHVDAMGFALSRVGRDLSTSQKGGGIGVGPLHRALELLRMGQCLHLRGRGPRCTTELSAHFVTALPLIVAAYLLPVLAGIASTAVPADWSESAGWPVLAERIGGRWLGVSVAVAAPLFGLVALQQPVALCLTTPVCDGVRRLAPLGPDADLDSDGSSDDGAGRLLPGLGGLRGITV